MVSVIDGSATIAPNASWRRPGPSSWRSRPSYARRSASAARLPVADRLGGGDPRDDRVRDALAEERVGGRGGISREEHARRGEGSAAQALGDPVAGDLPRARVEAHAPSESGEDFLQRRWVRLTVAAGADIGVITLGKVPGIPAPDAEGEDGRVGRQLRGERQVDLERQGVAGGGSAESEPAGDPARVAVGGDHGVHPEAAGPRRQGDAGRVLGHGLDSLSVSDFRAARPRPPGSARSRSGRARPSRSRPRTRRGGPPGSRPPRSSTRWTRRSIVSRALGGTSRWALGVSPPPQSLARGSRRASRSVTRAPRLARSRAAVAPAGPAPTTAIESVGMSPFLVEAWIGLADCGAPAAPVDGSSLRSVIRPGEPTLRCT